LKAEILSPEKMQKLITENLNYNTDIVGSCCSMLGEIIVGFFFFLAIFIKSIGRGKKKEHTTHSASDNEKCILPTSFLPLWVDDMPVFFWPII